MRVLLLALVGLAIVISVGACESTDYRKNMVVACKAASGVYVTLERMESEGNQGVTHILNKADVYVVPICGSQEIPDDLTTLNTVINSTYEMIEASE